MATKIKREDLTIIQGDTYSLPVRYGEKPVVYKAITAITNTAPVAITAVGHGLVSGWPACVLSAGGMKEINADEESDLDTQQHVVTVSSVDVVTFNDVNAADFKAYTSGGYLRYLTPVDLAGYTARATVRNKFGGTELFSLTTENNRILINNTTKTITLTISATDTAALTFTKGYYDLEMVSPSGVVTKIMWGYVSVTREFTS